MTDLRNATAVAKAEGAAPPATRTIFDFIRAQEKAIARALPSHMTAERFTRIVATEVRRVPKLAQCDELSFLGALMVSAQLGLEPGPQGHVYFIPFGEQVQLIVGYRGYIDLAYRSNRLASISAHDVRENDTFDYAYGLNERLEHVPGKSGERGPLTHAYAVARFKEGGHAFVVLDADDVAKRRARSQAAKSTSSPWKTDEPAMWRKSAVRALVPFLPLSAELNRAVNLDESRLAPASLDSLSDLDVLDLPSEEDGDGEASSEAEPPAEGEPKQSTLTGQEA